MLDQHSLFGGSGPSETSRTKIYYDCFSNTWPGKVTEDVKEITLTIHNQKGLHARAAAKFVNVTSKFKSEIKVSKENENVSGKSIMGLLMLTAVKGTTIRITANGVTHHKF